jgi:hypothetical protein
MIERLCLMSEWYFMPGITHKKNRKQISTLFPVLSGKSGYALNRYDLPFDTITIPPTRQIAPNPKYR